MPEIDDGARTIEEAVEMARIAAEDGIEYMVSTPHMFNGLSHNPEPPEIVARVAALNEAIKNSAIQILPGNEVHISHEIADHVKNNRVTRINEQNYVLVELPAFTVPLGVEHLFHEIRQQGVQPILVHPERNAQIQAQPSILAEYIERGVFVQVTAMSVTGEFGPAAQSTSEILLRHNCVHFLATDAHRPYRRPPILSKGRDAAAAIIGEERARALVEDNPRAVIEGASFPVLTPLPFEAATPRRSFLSRF